MYYDNHKFISRSHFDKSYTNYMIKCTPNHLRLNSINAVKD